MPNVGNFNRLDVHSTDPHWSPAEETDGDTDLIDAEDMDSDDYDAAEFAATACEDYPCCGHENGDCNGQKYGSDESIKRDAESRIRYEDEYGYGDGYGDDGY